MNKKRFPHFIKLTAFMAFIVLGFLACASTPPTPRETAEKHYQEGKKLAEKGDWRNAYIAYSNAIKSDPDFAEAYFGRGRANHILNRGYEAINDYNKCIKLEPQAFGAYFNRGIVYRDTGNAFAYTNAFGYSTNAVGTSDVTELTRALQNYDLALLDFNKALEATNHSEIQQRTPIQIAEVQKKKSEVEKTLAASTAQRKATEETNRYNPANFTVIPNDFLPSDYTTIDLFRAASNARNLQIASNKQEAILSQMNSSLMLGLGGSYALQYVSDLTFVRQDGTNIAFSSDDNAITQNMTIDQRSGLQAGQRVRVYYLITRSPLTTWDVIAIERR